MRAGLFLVFVVAGPTWAASSVDVPRYSTEAFCEARKAPSDCLASEERKRSEVVSAWSQIPIQRRHFCIQNVRFMSADARSYSALWQCLSGVAPTS